jgi:hypothetical protein
MPCGFYWLLLPSVIQALAQLNKDQSVLRFWRYTPRWSVPLMLTIGLAGCAGQTPVQQAVRSLPERVELTGVPAFPESAFWGAPSAVSSLLAQQGVVTSPGLVAKQLQLPEQESQLQENIVKKVNSHGLLVYPLAPDLPALLKQVAAGYPVLLRFNQGYGWLNLPRYAVLIGYDRKEQILLLRSGSEKRWETSFSSFQSAWQSAGSWAVLVLAPVQLPVAVDAPRWLQAADELQNSGQLTAANNARKILQRQSTLAQ